MKLDVKLTSFNTKVGTKLEILISPLFVSATFWSCVPCSDCRQLSMSAQSSPLCAEHYNRSLFYPDNFQIKYILFYEMYL